MNIEVIAAVLRLKIDRSGPSDELWLLGSDRAKARMLRVVRVHRPPLTRVNELRAKKRHLGDRQNGKNLDMAV